MDYSTNAPDRTNRLIFPLACITTAATLLLIFMGGLVTSHGAGMSVPDWPNSYGYNMFTFPVSKWVGGIFYEHTHRLMGSLVGFCSLLMFLHAWGWPKNFGPIWKFTLIGVGAASIFGVWAGLDPGAPIALKSLIVYTLEFLALMTFITGYALLCRHGDGRKWIQGLTLAVLLGVVFQGLLGGFRVVLIQLGLAIIHACVAQAFLCLVALLALVSSRRWLTRQWDATGLPLSLVTLMGLTVLAIYGQLIVGALMRHNGAGLAIPDLPLAYGHVLPPMDEAQLNHANALRLSGDPRYSFPGVTTVTLAQVWLHFAHRCGALLVSCLLGGTLIWTLAKVAEPALRRPAWLLVALLITQISLGWLTVEWRKPADIASTHVAVGAATLMTTFILYVRARKARNEATAVTETSTDYPTHSLVVPA